MRQGGRIHWTAVTGVVLLVVLAPAGGAALADGVANRTATAESEAAAQPSEVDADRSGETDQVALTKGQVTNVEVVNELDRDGDGYVSGFRVRVEGNSQAYEYEASEGQKKFAKGVAKVFGYVCTIPGCGWAMKKWVEHVMNQRFYLVPGYVLTAETDHGERSVARFYYNQPGEYPGPGETESTAAYTVGRGENMEPLYLPVDAHSGPMASVLDGESRTTVRGLEIETCWNLELRGGGKETGDDICATTDEWREISAIHAERVVNSDRFEETQPQATYGTVRVEPPELDRTAEVTIRSNPSDAVVSLDGERLGRTPWTGEVPVDVGDEGTATLELEKDGYEPTAVERQIVDDPRAADPGGEVSVTLDQVTKPIAVHSEPDDATVLVDGQEAGTTAWAEWFWVKDRPNITVDAEGYVPHRVENVEPGESLDVTLITWDQFESSTTTVTDPIYTDPLEIDPTLDFNLTTFSNESEEYVTDYDPTLTTDLTLTEPTGFDDLTLETDLEGVLVANLTATPAAPLTDQSVVFDGSGSFDINGSVVEYRFDFGDGTSERGQSPTATHRYADPGTYQVDLTVTDAEGETAQTTRSVTVENRPPQAIFGLDATAPETGQQLQFDAAGATDPDGAIVAYEWDLGDGRTATGESLTHEYADPGDYTVELTVTDDDGDATTSRRTVSVRAANERPNPTFDVATGSGGEVTFDATDATDPDGEITEYVWDFGDDAIQTGETVTHAFEESGTYEVELMVVDDDRAAAVHTRTVAVDADGGTPTETTSTSSGTTDSPTTTTTDTPAGTSDPQPTPTRTTDVATAGEDGAGFGPGVAILAVIVVAVVARRRS
jgi:PGF-CTERM protein